MSTVSTWPVLVILGSGFGTLYLISYLVQYRHKPGANWFILTLIGQATFCFAYGIGLVVFEPTVRLWLEIIALIGLAWLGVPFLGFALGYTGRSTILNSWLFRGLLIFPIATTVLLPLNVWREFFFSEFEITPVYGMATVTYSLEPILFFGVLGAGVVVGAASLILFETVLSYGPLYRKEAAAVALSPVPPIVGLFPWLFGFGPIPAFNTIAIGLLPHVILDTYAFRRSDMFDFYPATNRAAERSTVADLDSPIIILEERGRIVDCNESAERILGLDSVAVIARPVEEVLALDFESLRGNSPDAKLKYTVRSEGQRHVFLIRSSPLLDSGGRHVGYTLLFQNITEAVQREERLAVLNRVLRHNLRNDLSVIGAFVDTARRQTEDDEVARILQRSQDKVKELVETGETAREIEQTIDQPVNTQAEVTLDAIVSHLVEKYEADYPEAIIRRSTDETAIETDSAVLEAVLDELIENALIHGAGDPLEVMVTVTDNGDTVELSVRNTGPGISEYEVESLEQGDESALEHGSGLGLWLVKWGVIQLGGELSFDGDADGTTVTIELPRTQT